MTILHAIDPGPTQSGYCSFADGRIIGCGKIRNSDLLADVMHMTDGDLVIEQIASYGMPVGREVFDTCIWIGRFIQAYPYPEQIRLIERKQVKLYLCGTTKAKDANIRQALIDRFPATGGGKIPQIGTKGKPGPLFGVKKDAWAALALAITAIEGEV